MPKMNRYNVYDNGELILEYATRTDVKKLIGDAPVNMTNYADKNVKYQGRYTFKVFEECKVDENFIREWREVVSLFKNVIWVKTGGHKLCIGKQ